MKLCKDCKHYEESTGRGDKCFRKTKTKTNRVTGKKYKVNTRKPHVERFTYFGGWLTLSEWSLGCGPRAIHFKPKDHTDANI